MQIGLAGEGYEERKTFSWSQFPFYSPSPMPTPYILIFHVATPPRYHLPSLPPNLTNQELHMAPSKPFDITSKPVTLG